MSIMWVTRRPFDPGIWPTEEISNRPKDLISTSHTAAGQASNPQSSRFLGSLASLLCVGAATTSTSFAWAALGSTKYTALFKRMDNRTSNDPHCGSLLSEFHSSHTSSGWLQQLLNHEAALPSAFVLFSLSTTTIYTLHESDEHQDDFILSGMLGGLGLGAAWGMGLESTLLAVLPWTVLTALLISALVHALARSRCFGQNATVK